MRWLLAIHLLLSPLLFSTWTAEAFEANKAALLLATAIVAGAIGVATWPASLRRQPGASGTLPGAVPLGFLLLGISAAISTAFSVNPLISWRGDYDSWLGLRTILAYLVLFFATRRVCGDERGVMSLLAAVAAASFVASLYALVQWAGHDLFAWTGVTIVGGRFRPFSTVGHPNYLGAYLAMALPLNAELCRRALLARRWLLVGLLLAAIGLSGVAIALTLSRAAWLATVAAVIVLAVGWWRTGARRVGLGVALVVGLAAVFLLPFVAGDRLRHLADGGSRYPIWRTAWRLFLDRPVCGWGTDAFRLAFGTHRPTEYWALEGNITPSRAHNETLHLLATQGVLGAVAALVLLVGLTRAAWRSWQKAMPEDRPLIAAVVAALVAFFVQGMFGFTVIGVGTLFVTLAAFLQHASCVSGERREIELLPLSRKARSVPLACALGAGGLLWFAVITPLRSSIACGNGDSLRAQDPMAAVAFYQRAVALDPGADRAWTKLSAVAQQLARFSRSIAEWQRYDDLARSASDRAVALVPADPYHHASRARWLGERAFLGRGDARAALDEWDAALALDPDNAELLAEAGRTALAIGDRAAAVRRLEHGWSLYPNYAPFPGRLGTLALAEGRLDDARTLLEKSLRLDWQHDEEDRARVCATLATVYLGLRQFESAWSTAASAGDAAPSWTTPLLLQGQAAEQLGRTAEAIAAYRHALQLEPANSTAKTALVRLKVAPSSE